MNGKNHRVEKSMNDFKVNTRELTKTEVELTVGVLKEPLIVLERWGDDYDIYAFDIGDLVHLPEWVLPYVQTPKRWDFMLSIDTMLCAEQMYVRDHNYNYPTIREIYTWAKKFRGDDNA